MADQEKALKVLRRSSLCIAAASQMMAKVATGMWALIPNCQSSVLLSRSSCMACKHAQTFKQ